MRRSGGARKVWLGPGQSLTLARLVKSGGAGSVYLLSDARQQVAKLYHAHLDRGLCQRKIDAMLRLSPELPDQVEQGKRYVQIAWPQAPLRDARGNFIGFVMPVLDIQRTAELEEILLERQARAAGLPTGLGAKITLAANLSAVIAALHRQRHYVVDLKPVNLRFYRDSLYIAMLDCDGFSIQGEAERFPAQQFTVDYLAPELQGRAPVAAGEEIQDRFALAVVVFQLLNFGIHPFSGKPVDGKVPTELAGRIREGCYAYGVQPNPRIAPNPTSGHTMMPAELRRMFDRAFAGPGEARPTAVEWAQALRGYALRDAGGLQACAADASHQHFAGFPCAACARAALIAKAAATTGKGNARKGARKQASAAPGGSAPSPRLPPPVSLPLPAAQHNVTHIFFAAVAVIASIVLVMLAWPHDDSERSDGRSQVVGANAREPEVLWRRDVSEAEFTSGIALATARADVRAVAAAASSGRYEDVKLILRRLHEGEALSGGENSAAYVAGYAADIADFMDSRDLGKVQGRTAGTAAASIDPEIDRYRDRLVRAPRAHYAALALGKYHLAHGEPQAASAFFTQAIWARPLDHRAWYGMAAAAWNTEGEAAALVYYAVASRFEAASRPTREATSVLPIAPAASEALLPHGRWQTLGVAAESLVRAIDTAQEFQARAASVEIASMERLSPWIRLVAERPEHGKSVELRMTLDRLGEPSRVAVIRTSGSHRFDRNVATAASRWNYLPALKDGRLSAGSLDLLLAIDP